MEKNAITDIINTKNNDKKMFLPKKDRVNLTVCFCQCDCDCHKVTTQTNNEDSKQNSDGIKTNIQKNPSKKNSFSKNYSKPIKKEYSFDYYNNNIDMNAKLSKDLFDNKLYLYTNSRSDNNNLDAKTEEFVTKESQMSYQGYEFSNNFKNHEIESNNNNNENDYILYRNDIKDFKQFIKKLHDIKKDEKTLNKCASLKSFNNKNIYINDYQKNFKKNNYLEKYSIKNKKNLNISNDNGHFLKNNKKNDNIRKKNKKLSIDSKNNNNYFKDNNWDYKISQRKNIKNILSPNNVKKPLKHCRSQKSDLIYNNSSKDLFDTKFTTYRINNNSNNKKENSNLYNYKEDIIKENNNEFNNYNYNIILTKKIHKNRTDENKNKYNPLGNIVNNFVSMLKYKNNNNYNISNIHLNNKKSNVSKNKYYDNIMKKKMYLDNMSLSKIKPECNFISLDSKYKDYSNIEDKSKNINKINKNEKGKGKNILNLKEDSEKKYINKKIKNKLFNNNNILNETYDIKNNNNNIYNKISKYNESNENYNNYENKNKINIPIYRIKNNGLDKDINNNKYYINYNNLSNNKLVNKIDNNNNISKKNNNNYYLRKKENIFKIEKFDILIKDKDNKNKNEKKNTSIYELQLTPSKINKKIEIQTLSHLSFYPISKKYSYTGSNNNISGQNVEHFQILTNFKNNKEKKVNKRIETVSQKVFKLINQKAKINSHNLSLSSKLNLDTNLSLSLSEENDSQNDNINMNIIKRNIPISPKTIFTIYYNKEKPLILAFDIENKTFSFQDYSDFGNFEENYKLAINKYNYNKHNNINKGNIFITIDTNLYIVTGKNYDMLYMFDSTKKVVNKLSSLKNNHSNGNLLHYENSIICLSGDYNKKVEKYSINRNEWSYLPEMLIERSNSASCIINKKNNRYIINLFGYNSPTKEYLNTIEYLDINKEESCWKYLKYNNPNLIFLNISNLFCINFEDNKIIIIGGCNEKENKYNNKFIQIIFGDDNLEGNIIVEKSDRKLKDININKKYSFNNGYKFYSDEKNEKYYEILDSELNCHLFQVYNMVHDIFYLCN